jgi:DNA ligase-1
MSASWINKLNESDSRLHKEEVIKQALIAAKLGSTNAITFLNLAKDCYNPFITFGIRQVPEGFIDSEENPWQDFQDLLNQLHYRNLTGNDARDAVQAMSERFSADEWNTFCAPVIRRDLRAGVSEKTFNKICKKTEYEIPVFGCQLASNCEDRPEMKGIKRLEKKLDGVRVLMKVEYFHKTNSVSNVVSYSRNGKVFENFQHIEDQICNSKELMDILLKTKHFGDQGPAGLSFILDGEIVGNSFQELMRQARRKENVQNDDSVFHIFDIIPTIDFHRGYWNAQLRKRVEILEQLRPVISNMPNVELLDHVNVDLDTAEGLTQFNQFCKDVVAQGFEGAMIKNLEAPYECKRNMNWMKFKPTITVDLTVIGVEEGTGRNLNRLGALVCEGEDHGKFIQVNAGSGFSDQDREQLWEDKNLILGRTVEILCDAVTQNQDGSYSLRFPRFVRFRDDK